MLRRSSSGMLWLALGMIACGGQSESHTNGKQESGGAAGVGGSAGAGGYSGARCEALIERAIVLLETARACDPASAEPACMMALPGLCPGCTRAVSSLSHLAVRLYDSVRQELTSHSCAVPCTDVVCHPVAGICSPTVDGDGICR